MTPCLVLNFAILDEKATYTDTTKETYTDTYKGNLFIVCTLL